MAQIRVGGAQRRPQYAQRLFTARPTRGGVTVAAWPRPQPKRQTTRNQSVMDRMKRLVRISKSLHPREAIPMASAVRQHGRTHTGVRGSANIRLRDLEVQRLAGRLWAIELPDRTIYPAVVKQDVGESIDWTEPSVGGVLTRTAEGWRAASACTVGAVFTATPDGALTGCCPVAGPAPPDQVPLPPSLKYA